MAARVAPLWQVGVEISGDAGEAVGELLGRVFDAPASDYTDLITKVSRVSVYVPKVTAAQKAELNAGLRLIAEAFELPAPKASIRKIKREDWAESWKRHFKPIEVSARLLVKPSWSKRKPRRGQQCVILDPGLSFGTGQHPTTGFCLAQIDGCREADQAQSFLDVGCGSGILAIAAAKIGYTPVRAFDFDPDAVRVAAENAQVNRVSIDLTQQDLTRLPKRTRERYDVICANLTYDLLLSERDKLLNRLADGGTIVLAGILETQFRAVDRAFREAGMKRVDDRVEGEWRSAAYRER